LAPAAPAARRRPWSLTPRTRTAILLSNLGPQNCTHSIHILG
jgi:hypothetical protein